ncbi:MAG: hypothetical protein ACPGF7_05990 [Pontibacterium sp.]
MKQIDLEQYHVCKNSLLEIIEKAGNSDSAHEAKDLITSLENSMEQRMDQILWDNINVMCRIKNMLKAEINAKKDA